MSAMPAHEWVFPARCTRVVDGDTLYLVVDLGHRLTREDRYRLRDVDTPEPRGETAAAGKAATAFTRQWVVAAGVAGWPLLIETVKDPDDFGRYLAHVWRRSDGRNLTDDLIAAGYDTGKRWD